MTVPQTSKGVRAALYLRVSTARQAEHDVSIPDQRKQGETWCASRGYQLVDTFVEAGASATNDRRPEFQRMIEAGTSKPAPFDIVVVHSFSRFFRDHFEMEFYVRKLAKNGVKLVSITQEMGDDPMHVMMRHPLGLTQGHEIQSRHGCRRQNYARRDFRKRGQDRGIEFGPRRGSVGDIGPHIPRCHARARSVVQSGHQGDYAEEWFFAPCVPVLDVEGARGSNSADWCQERRHGS